MRLLVFLLCIFAVHLAFSKDTKNYVKERIKQAGLNNKKVSYPGELDRNTPFDIKVIEKEKILGMDLVPGTSLFIEKQFTNKSGKGVDGETDAISIITPPDGTTVKFQGAHCKRIWLIQEDLVDCILAENLKVYGMEISAENKVIYDRSLKKGNVAIPVLVELHHGKLLVGGKEYTPKNTRILKISDSGVSEHKTSQYYERLHPRIEVGGNDDVDEK